MCSEGEKREGALQLHSEREFAFGGGIENGATLFQGAAGMQ